MKLLLYCTKAKPYLYPHFNNLYFTTNKDFGNVKLNGKIVAECDYEVEIIRKGWGCLNGTRYFRNNMNHYYPDYELEKQSCLSFDEINKYLKGTLNENCGYAIHINNLHIFDKPRWLYNVYYKSVYSWGITYEIGYHEIHKAPQNMMYVYDKEGKEKNILISIRPEWLCKILNGEKTIEVRKKVLKEMI